MVSLMWVLLLGWAGNNQAQETRIAVFALNCFVPLTHGLHTRAELRGQITFTNRTAQFTAHCFDGPSASLFPALQRSDGKVQALDLSVVTLLEDSDRQVIAQNSCHADARNGFLTLRCLASEANGGEVELLVSIEPPPLESTAERASP
jgi:hypothetical protein